MTHTERKSTFTSKDQQEFTKYWYMLSSDPIPNDLTTQMILKLKKLTERKLKKKRAKRIKKRMKHRETEFFNNQKMEISKLLERNLFKFDSFYCKDENGNVIVNNNEVLEQVATYFENLYKFIKDIQIESIQIDTLNNIDNNLYSSINDPFTLEELKTTIKRLPNKKTPPSTIPNEILKILDLDNVQNVVLKLLNDLKQAPHFPSTLNNANVILIPKIEDWKGDLSNLRPITLINTFKKLFSSLLTARLTKILDDNHILQGFNFGFMQNLSTKDPLLIFRYIIDDAKIHKKSFYSATLDVAKAYDSVPFNSIFQSLKRLKIPDSFIDQVKKLLERSVCIETPIGTTRIIHVEKGLPQADPMSPILWHFFLMRSTS